MKILIIGGTGTIGKAIVKELSKRHQVIIIGRERGEVNINILDLSSIQRMYEAMGKIDAVIAATGKVHAAPFSEMTAEDFQVGLNNKLMGQVNLVSAGLSYMNDGGSFTLTAGILNHAPIRGGSSAAMVNGALEGFVRAAAIELPRSIRINAVSPTILTESLPTLGERFLGFKSVPASDVALAYSRSVEGAETGKVYRVGY